MNDHKCISKVHSLIYCTCTVFSMCTPTCCVHIICQLIIEPSCPGPYTQLMVRCFTRPASVQGSPCVFAVNLVRLGSLFNCKVVRLATLAIFTCSHITTTRSM